MGNFEPGQSANNSEPRINGETGQTSQPEVLSELTTGPWTLVGKQRSKINAVKHGIFTAWILKGLERKADYAKLVEELRDYFQPQGTPEELLVEKLASLLWRERRLMIAESAEILKASHSDETLRTEALEIENQIHSKKNERGLFEYFHNPFIVDRCLELLTGLRERICQRGYDPRFDTMLMRKLFGRVRAEELDARAQEIISHPSSRRERHGHDVRSSESQRESYEIECKALIDGIDNDIEFAKHVKNSLAHLSRGARAFEKHTRLVPPTETVDRIIRYGAHLSREFDRTLNQFDRLRRMRLGLPAHPQVNVQLNP